MLVSYYESKDRMHSQFAFAKVIILINFGGKQSKLLLKLMVSRITKITQLIEEDTFLFKSEKKIVL